MNIESRFGEKIGHIWDPVFKQNFYIVICSVDRIKNLLINLWELDKKSVEKSDFFHGKMMVFEQDGQNIILFWMTEPKISYLNHELSHATFTLMRDRNIKDEEAHTYYIEFLSDEIIPNLNNLISTKEVIHMAKGKVNAGLQKFLDKKKAASAAKAKKAPKKGGKK
jgi:hypothetical protein